ncbi:MAG: hypothetical protein ACRDJH_09620 [Thermomicrobiales bacterium]
MDGKRFDDLSRALAQGRTRRGVLKGLAAGVAAGVAALTRRGDAAAQRLPNGAACRRATQCASFQCADGVCCTTSCTGQCEACDLAGAVGACTPLPAGSQQHGARPACTGTAVCQASCDGVETRFCTQYPGLDISCAPGTCDNGFGYTYGCGGDGTCHPLDESCGLYVCAADATACLTTCRSDRECVGAAFCLNGVCQEDRELGEECTADAQCQSGICAQGVCCASACPGGCEACNVPGNLGFCTVIPDGGACDGGICCDGDCVDTSSDLEHCGACDNACDLTPNGPCELDPICQAGNCTFTPQPATVLCRPAAGICDVDDYCDGVAIVCPPDAFQLPSVECRAAAGICDAAEFCTGTGPDCPPDLFAPPSQVCRAVAGPCDLAEFCTGASAACPPDAFLSNSVQCRPGGTGIHAVCDPPEVCSGSAAACPPDAFTPVDTACETGNPCTNDICNGQGMCVTGAPRTCPNPEHICVPSTGACVCPTDQPLDCGAFCGVECCVNNQCSPTELCDATGTCVPQGIDLRRVDGGVMEVDDDLTISVNGAIVFEEHDGVITTYPPFNLSLNNGDQIRVQAFNVMCCRAHIDAFELFRPSDGTTQVLEPATFDETDVGAGLILDEFYDETFTVNLPPNP